MLANPSCGFRIPSIKLPNSHFSLSPIERFEAIISKTATILCQGKYLYSFKKNPELTRLAPGLGSWSKLIFKQLYSNFELISIRLNAIKSAINQ